jgi:hypothetical protein
MIKLTSKDKEKDIGSKIKKKRLEEYERQKK